MNAQLRSTSDRSRSSVDAVLLILLLLLLLLLLLDSELEEWVEVEVLEAEMEDVVLLLSDP